jgi:hypothetical protein
LLAADSPVAVADNPTPRDNTIRMATAGASASGAAPLVLVGRRAPEFLSGLLEPAGLGSARISPTVADPLSEKRTIALGYKPRFIPKPVLLIGVLAISVLAVATLISFSIESQSEAVQKTPEETTRAVVAPPPKRTKIAPVTIHVEDVVVKKEELAPLPAGDPEVEQEKVVKEEKPAEQKPVVTQVRRERERERPRSAPAMQHKTVRFPDRPVEKPLVVAAAPQLNTKGKQIGYLNVGAKPWAEIAINGKAWPYQTPQAGIELPVGKHTVTLFNRETGVTRTKVVQIKQGTYQTISMDMTRK